MFDRSDLWLDVGYAVKSGALSDGSDVTLARTPGSSPEFLEEPGKSAPLIEFLVFGSAEAQAKWICDQIEKNITKDELNFDDIIVINPDPLTTVREAGHPRRLLFERGIQSHVAGVDTSSDIFFKGDEKSVAFTGIFRAKGNEAGMVYVMNAQDCYSAFGALGKIRNQLFTAMTRSKAWVRVTGVGAAMLKLKEEYERVANHNFELNFTYPTESIRQHLRVINRDLTPEEQRSIRGAATNLSSLVSDIETGKVLLEDLPAADLDVLRRLIAGAVTAMASAELIRTQIEEITADLISAGLCIDQNFPILKMEEENIKRVIFSGNGSENLSVTLKNIPYSDAYVIIRDARSFNLKLIDGALVQMLYKFSGGEISAHRLAFFPSPDLLEYQNNSEIYEEDEIYGDVIEKGVVTSPIRFDFDPLSFVEYHHPSSHLTIGQYKNCRISVTGPLTPFAFMNFILRSFYNTAYRRFSSSIREYEYTFSETIVAAETRHIHLRVAALIS